MIILVAGATHSGKTAYAQKLLEAYRYPYLSLDHLKMGLIRSGQTSLTPMGLIRSGQTKLTPTDDDKLTEYLWPILREMVKTAIENKQNLIVEGCYIPFDWQKDFEDAYLSNIRYVCLVMTKNYIEKHFDSIVKNANVVECRLESELNKDNLIAENLQNLALCQKHKLPYILSDEEYVPAKYLWSE